MTNDPPTTPFLTAFRTRRAYCHALLELADRQRALIAADETGDLLSLLTHKQQVLDALLDAGRQPVNVWQTWPTERERLPRPLRQECEQTLADTEDLLRQLMAAEEACAELLTSRRDACERALCAVNHGGAAQAAYGSPLSAVGSRRLDVDL
jgi:hypothetical protein